MVLNGMPKNIADFSSRFFYESRLVKIDLTDSARKELDDLADELVEDDEEAQEILESGVAPCGELGAGGEGREARCLGSIW